MTQTESLGGFQDKVAEVRDLGVNLGCDGAEGGSKVINSLYLNSVCKSKQVCAYMAKICKRKVSFAYLSFNNTNIPQKHHSKCGLNCQCLYIRPCQNISCLH